MDLGRFHAAQAGMWETALLELRTGQKRTHWMWFVFPQIAGLGRSPTAQYYALSDLTEARAFLADPVLGPHLLAAARAACAAHAHGRSAEELLGPVDALKLCSSATLFEAAGGGPDFTQLLDSFFGGRRCAATLAAIARENGA